MTRRSGRIGRFLRDRRGASAVEFGLVMIPLLMLSFGIIEISRMLWAYEALQQSAIAGARCMGIRASSCAVNGSVNTSNTTSYIQQTAIGWGLTVPAANVTLTPNATCGGIAGFSKVQLTYQFTTVMPRLVSLPSAGLSLTADACFPNNP